MPKKYNYTKKTGRPSVKIDYKEVERLASYGLTDKEIAKHLGITEPTITNRKKTDEKFFSSIKNGKVKADACVGKSLYHRATGYSHAEEQVFCHKGIVTRVETIKHYPPDPTSMIFWLKNRRPDLWRDKTDLDIGLQDPLLDKYKDLSNDALQSAAQRLASAVLGASKGNSTKKEAKSS